jgi:hypothetical protein
LPRFASGLLIREAVEWKCDMTIDLLAEIVEGWENEGIFKP